MTEKNYAQSKRDGSTKVDGNAKLVMDEGGIWDLQMHVQTRKSGIHGTGFGAVQLAILDISGTPFSEFTVTKTKGAELDGTAKGSEDKTFTLLPAITNKAGALGFVVNAQDRNGIPLTIDELKDFLKDTLKEAGITKLTKLPLGEAKEIGGVIFERLK